MDWPTVFGVEVPLTELLVRGTTMYWFLFLMFRFVLKRDVGSLGLADVLLLVIVADAAQNAMAGGYKSVTEGIVLVSVILFWNFLIDWLAFRIPIVRRLAEPPALLLIRNGSIQRRNLRKEMLTDTELMSHLRQQGIDDVARVKEAWMESDGNISVIPHA